MTMAIQVKNDDAGRVARVRESTFDVTSDTPQNAHVVTSEVGPGEARTYWIHAAKTLEISEIAER